MNGRIIYWSFYSAKKPKLIGYSKIFVVIPGMKSLLFKSVFILKKIQHDYLTGNYRNLSSVISKK